MNKKLGKRIRGQREALRLSQTQLAKKLGVQASYVAYIENNQRRPSLPLVKRIARALGLDPREVFFLSHPEAKSLLGESERPKPAGSRETDPWRQFLSSRALLKQHRVTASELKVLKQVSLLSDVSSPRDFLFILNTLRQAAEPVS